MRTGLPHSYPPSLLTVHPATDDKRSPFLIDSAPTQQISPPAASRQYSLVMPSLDPDKTRMRLRHNLRPLDRVACNTNIFHKTGRRWTQTFHILCVKSLTFCLRASLNIPHPDIWAHLLKCVWCFFFLIIEQPPSPLWQTHCPSLITTMYIVYIAYVYASGGRVPEICHLPTIRCPSDLPTALGLQLWRLIMAVKFLTQ